MPRAFVSVRVLETAASVRRELLARESVDRDLGGECALASMRLALALGDVSAFRVGFFIHGDRSRWVVHDIVVGNRSQFAAKRGPAIGTEFGPGGILEHMKLETLQTAMDFTLVVEYVGPEADGEVFEATVVGLSTDY